MLFTLKIISVVIVLAVAVVVYIDLFNIYPTLGFKLTAAVIHGLFALCNVVIFFFFVDIFFLYAAAISILCCAITMVRAARMLKTKR